MASSSVRKSFSFLIPEGDEVPFKTALYQIILLAFLVLCSAAVTAVFYLLQAFVKPILWAVLCGTVLFPFKRSVSDFAKSWLKNLRVSGTPLALGILAVPWRTFRATADAAWTAISTPGTVLLLAAYPLMQLLIHVGVLSKLFKFAVSVLGLIDWIVSTFSTFWVLPIYVLYSIVYVVWLWLQTGGSPFGSTIKVPPLKPIPEIKEENGGEQAAVQELAPAESNAAATKTTPMPELKKKRSSGDKLAARLLSIPIWFFTFCFISRLFGPLRGLAALALTVATLACLAAKWSTGEELVPDPVDASKTGPPLAKRSVSAMSRKPSFLSPDSGFWGRDDASVNLGDKYLRWLIGASALLFCSIHAAWVLYLLLFPLAFGVLERLGGYFGLWDFLWAKLNEAWKRVKGPIEEVTTVAIPGPVRQLCKMLFYGDQKIIEGFEASVDVLSSIIVMICLLVCVAFLSIFVVIQINNETINLVYLSTDVVNRTLQDENSTLHKWIGEATDAATLNLQVEELVENAYTYSRAFIIAQIKQLAATSDVEKAEMLEAQAKRAVDSIYEMWLSRDPRAATWRNHSQQQQELHDKLYRAEGVLVPVAAGGGFDDLMKLGMELDFSTIGTQFLNILKENLSTVRSVLDSLWSVLQSNFGILFSLVGGLFSLVLGFGFEILNFVVALIVFLTVLYYLLVTSTNEWKPIEWFGAFAPATAVGGVQPSSSSTPSSTANPFSQAIEEAIKGVFILSAKMAIFYGLYIWFLYTLFGLSVVFIPSALAFVFAAVPVLAPYWVCLPGAIELWLVRDSYVSAIVFVSAHLLPMLFVDAAFYAEVRGSHPYLTGLAVVGGMYWLGVEGIIIGPILLCCMLALGTLYRNTLSASSGPSSSKFKTT